MEDMEDCFFDSVVRGHHVFKESSLGEVLSVKEEEDNEQDIFAVQLKSWHDCWACAS